jgi:hypothetical protein
MLSPLYIFFFLGCVRVDTNGYANWSSSRSDIWNKYNQVNIIACNTSVSATSSVANIDILIGESSIVYFNAQTVRSFPYSIQLLQDTTQQPFRDEVTSDYDIVTIKEEPKSDSEILQKMLTKDESRLFTLVLAIQNKSLMFPMNMDGLLEQEDKDKKDEKKEKEVKCLIKI